MGTFEGFLGMLGTISDPRRGEGKVYQLPYVLLFSMAHIGFRGDGLTGMGAAIGLMLFVILGVVTQPLI